MAFTPFVRFCTIRAFLPTFDALPKVWKSAQKMYLEQRNWIDTLQSLNQRRQPRERGIDLGSKRAIDGDTCEVRGFRYQLVGMTEWPPI
ncbi:hypothetical protein [Burkholderia sp. BCC1977]|uniref:hypothetical protein n=1 Tax=Burkholderia sp. BCC1977 TaxID=2817440 RepID=UPI002ABDA640|nr:hypothetical protein [Burkholderia sp. BCC1977]